MSRTTVRRSLDIARHACAVLTSARSYFCFPPVKYLSFEAVNQDFQEAWALLRSDTCQGRMHWGKSGWPASGFRGAAEYPSTWCDFGCAVRELDPTGKFRARTAVWDWSANDMEACCGPDGFKHDTCTCR
jgi:hypothetical protein